jgi:hypothetical protein
MSSMTVVKVLQACVTTNKLTDVEKFKGYVEFDEKQGGILPTFSKANFELDENGEIYGIQTKNPDGTDGKVVVATKFVAIKSDTNVQPVPVEVEDKDGNPVLDEATGLPKIKMEMRLCITPELFEFIANSKYWNNKISGARGRSGGIKLADAVSAELKPKVAQLFELLAEINKELWSEDESKRVGIATVYVRSKKSIDDIAAARKSTTKKGVDEKPAEK